MICADTFVATLDLTGAILDSLLSSYGLGLDVETSAMDVIETLSV